MTALTTVAALRDYPAIPKSGEDSYLQRLIEAVSATVEDETDRVLAAVTFEGTTAEVHSVRGCHYALQLREWPVRLIRAIRLDGTALASTSYQVDSRVGHVFYQAAGESPNQWPEGMRHIAVDYDAGFDPVPADLAHAVSLQVSHEYARSKHLGLRTTVIGDGTQTATYIVDALLPEVARVVALYRRRVAR